VPHLRYNLLWGLERLAGAWAHPGRPPPPPTTTQDRVTNQSANYGFVKFVNQACAAAALAYLNGRLLFNEVRAAAAAAMQGSVRLAPPRALPLAAAGPQRAVCTAAGVVKAGAQPAPLVPPPPPQELRINWAYQASQREDTSTHYHVFVGDLGVDVSEQMLYAAFAGLTGLS